MLLLPAISILSQSLLWLKARSHGVMCDCDLLYQEMECFLRFSDFVHKVRWVWMRFPMYLHCWNCTSQSHRMGVEPNPVRCHHTPVHCTHMKSYHMNTLIDIHTIHFLHRSRKQKKSHRVNKPSFTPAIYYTIAIAILFYDVE